MTTNVEITKTFQTRNGTPVTVTGTLELSREVWLDGDTDTIQVCEISVTAEVIGKGTQMGFRQMSASERKQAPAGYSWVIGRLGLTDDQAEIIRSVRSELEAHPAWQEKQAQIAANEKAEAELQASRNAHPGWCPKCHSYCYGDCEA